MLKNECSTVCTVQLLMIQAVTPFSQNVHTRPGSRRPDLAGTCHTRPGRHASNQLAGMHHTLQLWLAAVSNGITSLTIFPLI